MVIKMFEHVVNELPIANQPLSAKYIQSFAYVTFKERIPKIIDEVIACLNNPEYVKQTCGEDAIDEVEIIVQKITNLKHSMLSDGPLLQFHTNDGMFAYASSIYNKMIEQRTKENNDNPPTWFQTDWLFAECYLYLKLYEILHNSKLFKNYDPFMGVKIESLLASRDAVLSLSKLLIETKKKPAALLTESEKKELFMFYLKCSLWGNKADLSLSDGKAVGADKHTFTSVNDMDSYILVDNANNVYNLLQNNDNVVDIILDNSGYELFNDLIFADFLIWSGFAKKIVFHGKNIPWFVSDVTPADFKTVLDLLLTKICSDNTKSLVNCWRNYLNEGKWETKYEPFWTLACDYSKMSSEAPELYHILGKSDLLIFKGDLNYRKLVGDIHWEPTTPFKYALRGFEPTNILALRTIKADTISGLPKEIIIGRLHSIESNWMIAGKYALVQFLSK